MGWLALFSDLLYGQFGANSGNTIMGLFSGAIENIAMMYTLLAMNPELTLGQWLNATLTAGIGGSLLSIGSASGIVLMGQSAGRYTFLYHLRWTPVILLGFIVSILLQYWLNARFF